MHSSPAESIETRGTWRATSVLRCPPATVGINTSHVCGVHIIIPEAPPIITIELPLRQSSSVEDAFDNNLPQVIHSGTRELSSHGYKPLVLIRPS